MSEFRGGNSRVLISTDVWARGLDVQQARYLPFVDPRLTLLAHLTLAAGCVTECCLHGYHQPRNCALVTCRSRLRACIAWRH